MLRRVRPHHRQVAVGAKTRSERTTFSRGETWITKRSFTSDAAIGTGWGFAPAPVGPAGSSLRWPVVLSGVPAHFGYIALGALVGLESLGLPLPGEAALLTAGALTHRGQLSIEIVIAVAACAAVVGDNVGYAIGARGGRRLLEREGPLAGRRREFLDQGERFYARYGPKAVFLARWVVGARVTAAWLAGVNHMPWRQFLVFNALGGVAWALTMGCVGYALGAAGARVVQEAGVAALIALVVGAGAAWWLHRRRRNRSIGTGESSHA